MGAETNRSGNRRGLSPRSRAALVPGGVPAAPTGNQRRVTHGAYARVAAGRLDAKVHEVFDALADDAPLRDAEGGLPAADGALVRLAAEALCRLDSVADYLARRGIEDEQGNLRASVLDIEGRLRREASDHLEGMAMSPRSRARLGVDLVRAQSFDPLSDWARRRDEGTVDAEAVDAEAREAS